MPLASCLRELWPKITTRGTQSVKALTIAVNALQRPGPFVTIATPTFPVLRAYPSAM
jgi:hypothetical protein